MPETSWTGMAQSRCYGMLPRQSARCLDCRKASLFDSPFSMTVEMPLRSVYNLRFKGVLIFKLCHRVSESQTRIALSKSRGLMSLVPLPDEALQGMSGPFAAKAPADSSRLSWVSVRPMLNLSLLATCRHTFQRNSWSECFRCMVEYSMLRLSGSRPSLVVSVAPKLG